MCASNCPKSSEQTRLANDLASGGQSRSRARAAEESERQIRDLLSTDVELASLVKLLRLFIFAFSILRLRASKGSHLPLAIRLRDIELNLLLSMLLWWLPNEAPILHAELPSLY